MLLVEENRYMVAILLGFLQDATGIPLYIA